MPESAPAAINKKLRLLLLSSSRTAGTAFLEHARGYLRDFLGTSARRITLIPFSAANWSCEEMAQRTAAAFGELGYAVESLHAAADPLAAVDRAEAFAAAGGNTFLLLREMQRLGLLAPVRERVRTGTPYIGWSAGSNLACPTIRTTNDMPIVWPEDARALDLLPFQINPHYTDAVTAGHQGETREERLQEFMRLNPGLTVVGLREGSALLLDRGRIRLLGTQGARLFRDGQVRELDPNESLQFLLDNQPPPPAPSI